MTEEFVNFNIVHPEPLLVVISGPSGVGKDAVVNRLKAREDLHIHFVVTAASRKPRVGETHGVDYFFVSKEEFENMIRSDELIEHAVVYNEYKGVPKAQVKKALQSGKDVIMRLDVQGAARVREIFPDAVLIFITPANCKEWVDRIKKRNTETPEKLQLRLETAKKELEYLEKFDYAVINIEGQLEKAVEEVASIIKTEHLRLSPRKINL